MPEIPSNQEIGGATVWFTSQAGITATVLAVFCVVLIVAIVFLVRYFGQQMDAAWKRVTAISEARSADATAMVEAIGTNTTALAVISARVDIGDRRGGR